MIGGGDAFTDTIGVIAAAIQFYICPCSFLIFCHGKPESTRPERRKKNFGILRPRASLLGHERQLNLRLAMDRAVESDLPSTCGENA